jgi:FADH2 O2-dependent halogenase
LNCRRDGQSFTVKARFVIDATGPRGALHRLLRLPEEPMRWLPPTQALFTHFRDLPRWAGLHPETAGTPPYPVDDAALHHVFDGGWIWVLRFNNGITSAGVAMTDQLAKELNPAEGAPAWDRLLARLPSVREAFAGSRAILPFMHMPRVGFRGGTLAGPGWAMLPSAAGFIDPLLSTGFPLTLLGITRLGRLLADAPDSRPTPEALANYAEITRGELDAAEELVGALYHNLNNFEVFVPLTLLYFAAASFSETARRLDRSERATGFLLHNDPHFGPGLRDCCALATGRGPSGSAPGALLERVRQTLAPFDVAGINVPGRANWYPVDLADLYAAAPKLGVTHDEIRAMLARVGMIDSDKPD